MVLCFANEAATRKLLFIEPSRQAEENRLGKTFCSSSYGAAAYAARRGGIGMPVPLTATIYGAICKKASTAAKQRGLLFLPALWSLQKCEKRSIQIEANCSLATHELN